MKFFITSFVTLFKSKKLPRSICWWSGG